MKRTRGWSDLRVAFEGGERRGGAGAGPSVETNNDRGNEALFMILAQEYLARYGTCFDAYMALQRALMQRYLVRGGTKEMWCERFAPAFRRRYGPIFDRLDCPETEPVRAA